MAHFWVTEKVKMKKILTKLLITQYVLIFGLWLWNKLGTFISWLWHCTEHKRCKVFTFFENSTFLNFFSLVSVPHMSKTPQKKIFICFKLETLVSMVSVGTYSLPNTQQFASNVKIKFFFGVISVSQGFHNLVLIYKMVILNTIFSSRLVGYSLNVLERSHWQRRNHL